MKILPKPIAFDWDEGNIDKNFIRHGVTNKEAEEVFNNEPPLLSEDVRHSTTEKRFQALSKTNNGRLLRVISARDMNKKEVKVYEKT